MDMRLEVVVLPVSDVDRAKEFYAGLGWRLDADFVDGDDFRVVQLTPPGSPCSIIFGTGITTAAPGSAPFLTATAVATSIQNQALTQKMIAAELRQVAGRLAHSNAVRKRGATYTNQFGGSIQKMLQPH